MHVIEVATFEAVHRHLGWPWIAIDPSRTRFAFASGTHAIATRVLADERVVEGATFALPRDLGLPTAAPSTSTHHGAAAGLHGFAIAPDGARLAVTGTADGQSIVATLAPDGTTQRSRLDALTGEDFVAHAVAFDRGGTRLWVSAERAGQTAVLLLDARTHEVIGVVRSAAFPPPSVHELHVHAQDDAVLLLAACGQDGTFARVVGFTDGPPIAIPGALDAGGEPSGFVGFAADGARVHLVSTDALHTRTWPGLDELSSADLPEGFASNYAGAVLRDRVLVDGTDADTGEGDRVVQFDRAARRAVLAGPPVPLGAWVGRLGLDAIVTVESTGDPARGRVVRLPAPQN